MDLEGWRRERPELPTTGEGPSCAFCDGGDAAWVHPLDLSLVEYREYGKGHTLPSFWTTCDRCEELLTEGNDLALLERMKQSVGFRPEIEDWTDDDVAEVLAKPLAVFRRADLAALPLPPAAAQ